MRNVRLIMSLLLLIDGIIFSCQYQVLDVCIRVGLSQSFRKSSIPAQELEKYGRFGMVEALPFDQYFSVSSALYDDYLDSDESIEIRKDLLKRVPSMIKNGTSQSILLEQYKFPKYLSKTFIAKLQDCQKNGVPFQHVIYKNKDNGKATSLALRYWVGGEEKKEERTAIASSDCVVEENKLKSNYTSDWVIDLFGLLALFM